MIFEFDLITLGWINCFIKNNDETIKIGVSSDYGDTFQELLTRLFNNRNYMDNDPYSFEIIWNDDMCQYHWLITVMKPKNYEIKILVKSTGNPNYSEELVDVKIKEEDLFADIYRSLLALYKKFGFVGYKEVWEVGNFPVYEFLILKSEYTGLTLKLDKYSEEWTHKVDSAQELDLLTN